MTRTGLPHSEMYGSLPACGSPYLFAAYRVLHRLSMPRHPPYALCSLITFRNFTFKVNHTMIMLSVFVKVCYPKMSFLPHQIVYTIYWMVKFTFDCFCVVFNVHHEGVPSKLDNAKPDATTWI